MNNNISQAINKAKQIGLSCNLPQDKINAELENLIKEETIKKIKGIRTCSRRLLTTVYLTTKNNKNEERTK